MGKVKGLQVDEAPVTPTKQCRKCGDEHPLLPEHWYFSGGRVVPPCKACTLAGQKARRSPPKADPAAVATANLPIPSQAKALRRAGQDDALEVFKTGAAILKRNAAQVIARVVKYSQDPTSPHHWDAIKLLSERALPVKGYSAVSEIETSGKSADKARPSVQINILPSTGAVPAPAIDVQVVPDEADA